MKKYFDYKNKQLVLIRNRADSEFWDGHWDIINIRREVTSVSIGTRYFVVRITKKYLKISDGPILEAGCGIGQNVYALMKNGFRCIGVDYAKRTIEKVNEFVPEIDIRCGDVRHLDFPDDYFAGIWSLGVIKHYYKGYDDILQELKRTLINGGFFFVRFPMMSVLRRVKAKLGQYAAFSEGDIDTKKFYQFVLNLNDVKRRIEGFVFKCIKIYNRGGSKGLKDEIRLLYPFLQKICDGKSLFSKTLNYLIDFITSPLAGHTKCMVFKKI